ncbi:Endocytosis and vacuole integrity protein [Emydomyces testavorans]|uniref:Endocytosis and vacuole integrity protein n=1 Tax=Emydomyces testavorans TaxID=2070801 RepID=A0AAF0ILF5_9EURO|nr:Endocytosis and vacuole integrity protein [Emydomyces testavorans]
MTSQFLQGELSTLIQDSKRKNSDLRNAAERSLNELKALSSTSEAQLAADLIRRPQFAKPFLLACHTRHAKLAAVGVGCIHRLVASGALPSEQLKDVIDSLYETTNLSLDVQLKVLQTLPSLFQRHGDSLSGQLLAKTLETCATIQNAKTVAVANTAAATLQQLVGSVFDKAVKQDEKMIETSQISVSLGDDKIIVSAASYDAFQVLDDLCRLVEGEKLEFLAIKSLSRVFILELIESILINNAMVFARHPEHAHVLRYRLMPLIVRFLSERQSFPFTVRVARILLLLLKSHIQDLAAESEVALSLLIHLLDTDASPPWKRVICMEMFKSLYSEPGLIRLIFSLFDENEGRKNILRDQMACLVRLAAEKPSLIGVSHQSTVPTAPESSGNTLEDQVALESVGVAGIIGSPATSVNACGISSQWSLLRTPYIETLDKLEAPTPPETYIYSLVLNCIGAFSESIAKFILPLTVAETKNRRKRRGSISNKAGSTNLEDRQTASESRRLRSFSIPVNPLDLEFHPQIGDIKVTAGIIDACWPAVLATSSTFLYAALDADYYHDLVRAFQKLTHVAGLLRLTTPRDAFLTTLAKAAVPADALNVTSLATALSSRLEDDHLSAPESPIPKSPSVADLINTSVGNEDATLHTRNLLCLRALLNLGIALGPTLDLESWSIILESLQRADLIIGVSSGLTLKTLPPDQNDERVAPSGTDVLKANFVNEISAVRTASIKLFECTRDYPNTSLKVLLVALLNLSEHTETHKRDQIDKEPPASSSQTGQQAGRIRQNKRSITTALGRSRIREDELKFVLWRISEVTKANSERLSVTVDSEHIWDIIVTNLVAITQNDQVGLPLRLKASDVLNNLVLDTIKFSNSSEPVSRNPVQLRGLRALKTQISGLYEMERYSSSIICGGNFQMHELALETLKSILEECGDSITEGWDLVFALISSVFETQRNQPAEEKEPISSVLPAISDSEPVLPRSLRLIRTAYNSLQLVASDFLGLLPASCLLELVETFSYFTSQREDFNISLTTTTFFWNISDFLRGQIDSFHIADEINVTSTEESLSKMARTADLPVSRNALWLLLLLKIVHVAIDNRTEIRNSAIQTLLRILDHYGQQLPPDAWHLCLNRILLMMAESVQIKLLDALQPSEGVTSDDRKPWIDTATLATKGLLDLIANFFNTIIQHAGFHQSWRRLLRCLDRMLKTKLLELESSILASFAEVLSRIKRHQDIRQDALIEAWLLWANNHPAVEGHGSETSNQEALLAYLNTYKQLYRLLENHLNNEQIVQVLTNFQLCVWESVTSQYSGDLERQSEVQSSVVGCLRALCLDQSSSQDEIIRCLGQFSDSALTKGSPSPAKKKPTFVAFSKASLQLLSWYITEQGINPDVLSRNTLSEAIEHLVNPILNKYTWPGKDCEPYLWQVATTASLDILKVAIPCIEKKYRDIERNVITNFWMRIVELTSGIVFTDSREQSMSAATVAVDEAFDISAFSRLRTLVIPALGSPFIPDKIRRDFAFVLFKSSLIFPPQRIDVPLERLKVEPLRDLYRVRRGRTVDPQPTLRVKLSYLLIDTLFELTSPVASNDEVDSQTSIETKASYVTLAKSISPYLILRCAITLKCYIADQPLRGLMPQPMASRKELLYLLHKLNQLRSEPAAIPAAGASVPVRASSDDSETGEDEAKYKKHLGWVYPLIVKGVSIAGREADDREVLEALTEILDSVAGHSALED